MFQISEPEPSGGSDSENETGATLLESASNRKPTFVYPVCWFEDEDSNMAVRWHFFAGVLFDLKSIKSLPWKLKLHFTNYPTSQLLPLAEGQVEVSLQNMYRHTLKQAMTLMSGNSKSAMNVTKESHGILWDAVQNSNYNLFRRVDIIPKTPVSYPVRVLVDTNPPIQKRVTNESLETLLSSWLSISYEEATVKVCGIEPPMHESIELLWSCFAYPDHFLYITVYTSSKDS
jgi:autophagy-related protein 5